MSDREKTIDKGASLTEIISVLGKMHPDKTLTMSVGVVYTILRAIEQELKDKH